MRGPGGDVGPGTGALDRVVGAVERRATEALRRLPDRGPAADLEAVAATTVGLVYRELDAELLAAVDDGAPGGVVVGLGRLHEALLELRPEWTDESVRLRPGATARKASGSYFTPRPLVEHLLDEVLEPVLDEAEATGGAPALAAVTVLDPACGAGIFLSAAARRIAHRLVRARGTAPTPAAIRTAQREALESCVHGVDSDPAVVELARVGLAHEVREPGEPAPPVALLAADALLDDWPRRFPEVAGRGGFDVVIGNPPFLNQRETLTTRSAERASAVKAASGGALGPYTDLSAVFLHRAPSWLRPGGRVGLVQPQSLLAARDAAGVRADLSAHCALESLWASDRPVFDAGVLTCAPTLRRDAGQRAVRRTHGPDFRPLPPYQDPDLTAEWSYLLAAGLGVPEVALPDVHGRLGDLASCTADYRDQYYGLAPYVREAADCPSGAPLITSGLIEPADCLWGRRDATFQKRRWTAPVIDVPAMAADPALARWAAARLVPKVLLATQGKVLEAVADPAAAWLPSVPTVTLAAPGSRLWHVLAVLLAPPVAAHAAARYAGTALTMRTIKLSAAQAARLPLPGDRLAWDRGADLARLAQGAESDPVRDAHLHELGTTMCAAYGVDDGGVLAWWRGRM